MYKHILLPTDGSELSMKASDHGITLAKTVGATITALIVSKPFRSLVVEPDFVIAAPDQYNKLIADRTEKYLDIVRNAATELGIPFNGLRIEHDHPYEAIIDTATKNSCDLIIMASHGLSGVSPVMLGSETLKVLTQSKIPVLVYR